MNRLALATLVLCLLPGAFASDDPSDRRTLRGITTIIVVIEELEPAAIADGLTVSQLRTDVELRLRMAGLKVLDSYAPGTPYLHVVPALLKAPDQYAYSCKLEFLQTVTVESNREVLITDTWSAGKFGLIGPPSNMVSKIRSTFADLVDKFINAYLSVNPK